MSNTFGSYVRSRRSAREDYKSLRRLSQEIGVQASYVSKIERNETAPPSEETVRRWAIAIDEDPDVLLAMAGKVSSDLKEAIMKRPVLFAQLIRQIRDLPDNAILRVVREVRDGDW